MDLEHVMTFFGHVMGRPAARKAIKGFVQEWVRDATWEEVQELITTEKSWLDLDQEAVTKVQNLLTHFPGVIESISFEEVLRWLEQSNRKLLIQVLSDTNGAKWLSKNFDLAQSSLLNLPKAPVIKLVLKQPCDSN